MTKIFIDLPDNIKASLEDDLPEISFVDQSDAELVIDSSALPRKPFKYPELIQLISNKITNSFVINGISFDLSTKTANAKNRSVSLTEKEVEILHYIKLSGSCEKEDLLREVWGYAEDANTRTVESHIHRLNQKLQEPFGQKTLSVENGRYSLIS